MVRLFRSLVIAVAVVTSFIIGVYVGMDNQPKPVKGEYNIDIYQGGKVVVTTRLANIETDVDNDRLVIYGKSTHEEIK